MRILFTLHDEFDPDAGGMGVTSGLASVYTSLGHEVEYVSFSDLPSSLPFRVKALLFPHYVAARLRRYRGDVVDSAVGDAWLWGWWRSRRRVGPPPLLVVRSHGLVQMADRARREEALRGGLHLSWKYPLYWGGYRPWEVARSLRAGDLCLLLNDAELDYAIGELRLPRDRLRVIDNGIPDSLLGLPRPDLPPPSQSFRVAHLGSYLPLKGVRYVATALSALLGAHPQARASFLGTGCEPARVLADFDPALHDRIEVRPRYPRAELPELLAGHAVVVSGTLKEGFPLGTLEAMACGLAAVTAATPGPLQYVRDGENGLVVPRADSGALAAALERLIGDVDLLAKLRNGAYETAQHYSWNRVAGETLALYEDALSRRSRATSARPRGE